MTNPGGIPSPQVEGNKELAPPPFSMYICPKVPAFRLRLFDGATSDLDEYVQFEHGSLKLEDKRLIDKMDFFLTKPHISALVQKVSWARAQAIAAKAAEEFGRKQRMAKGSLNTSHQNEVQQIFDNHDKTILDDAGIDPARHASITQNLADQGLVVTQKQNTMDAIRADNQAIAEAAAAGKIKLGA